MLAPRLDHQEVSSSLCLPSRTRPTSASTGAEAGPWHIQYHPKLGYIYGCTPNLFEKMKENEFEYQCLNNAYYPFQDQSEWELGRFICETMTGNDAERFLKLQWVGGYNSKFTIAHTSVPSSMVDDHPLRTRSICMNGWSHYRREHRGTALRSSSSDTRPFTPSILFGGMDWKS